MSGDTNSISVVIPTFDCGAYVEQAVESVRIQAIEGVTVHEIVIVDDGSTDDTAEVLERLSGDITAVRQDNAGPSAARNTGIAEASGDYLCLLDADDALAPGALAHHRARLDADPRLMVTQGHSQFVRRLRVVSDEGRIDADLDGQTVVTMNVGSCLFRREAFETVGGFDENLRNLEDIDWFLRAGDLGLSTAVDERLAVYRLRRHGSQSQRPVEELQSPVMHMVRGLLDRRRGASGAQ